MDISEAILATCRHATPSRTARTSAPSSAGQNALSGPNKNESMLKMRGRSLTSWVAGTGRLVTAQAKKKKTTRMRPDGFTLRNRRVASK